MNVQFAVPARHRLSDRDQPPGEQKPFRSVAKARGIAYARNAAKIVAGVPMDALEMSPPQGGRCVAAKVSRAALQAVRGQRPAARSGNEVDRRGDGFRARKPCMPLPARRRPPVSIWDGTARRWFLSLPDPPGRGTHAALHGAEPRRPGHTDTCAQGTMRTAEAPEGARPGSGGSRRRRAPATAYGSSWTRLPVSIRFPAPRAGSRCATICPASPPGVPATSPWRC